MRTATHREGNIYQQMIRYTDLAIMEVERLLEVSFKHQVFGGDLNVLVNSMSASEVLGLFGRQTILGHVYRNYDLHAHDMAQVPFEGQQAFRSICRKLQANKDQRGAFFDLSLQHLWLKRFKSEATTVSNLVRNGASCDAARQALDRTHQGLKRVLTRRTTFLQGFLDKILSLFDELSNIKIRKAARLGGVVANGSSFFSASRVRRCGSILNGEMHQLSSTQGGVAVTAC